MTEILKPSDVNIELNTEESLILTIFVLGLYKNGITFIRDL